MALLCAVLAMSRNLLKIVVSACLFLVLLLLLWNVLPRAVHERFETLSNPQGTENIGRLKIWGEAWGRFRQSPLLGPGPNNHYNTSIAFNQAERYPIYVSAYHPHNWLLLSLAENGLIGSGILFGYLALILFFGLVRLRTSPPDRLLGFEYGVWGGVLGFILHNQVDYFMWQPRMSCVFWLCILLMTCRWDSGGERRA